jgi:two-component system sensor histidine kinase DesK
MTLWPAPLLREPGHYRGMSAITRLWTGRAPGPSPTSSVASVEEDWRTADQYLSLRGQLIRRMLLLTFVAYFLFAPLFSLSWRHATPLAVFLLVGTVAFTGLVFVVFSWWERWSRTQAYRRALLAWMPMIVALGVTLFVVGDLYAPSRDHGNWLIVLTISAAICGRFTASIWPGVIGGVLCTATGLAVAADLHWNQGLVAAVLITPLLATFLAYTAGKRMETVATLRQTRAELAKVAVAEERLRIARDLHDLLGHSLSLITLKAELSRRMMATDAERAARELAELEAVARQSLNDVREAVAGYRQPDLAAELGAARQLLTAAGVSVRIDTPEGPSLPGEVDAALAWTVREGVTNVVRHAGAGRATIAVTTGQGQAVAEITDDGGQNATFPQQSSLPPVPGSEPGCPRPRRTGSGLVGLGERVRQLGGELAAGPVQPHGFRLWVSIPVASD